MMDEVLNEKEQKVLGYMIGINNCKVTAYDSIAKGYDVTRVWLREL